MKTLIPRKSPELLLNLVDEQFAYVVNCSFPNSFRVLNRAQYEIIKAINGLDDVGTIASRLGMQEETLQSFLLMLGKTEIIRFDNGFGLPQKPTTPNALNFWIHTTNACNLGCSYCYISTLNTGGGMKETVRQQLTHKFVEAVRTRGIRHIRLRLAGGEPMGQFAAWTGFIAETRNTLEKEGCRFDIAFITNLTILNEEIIEFSKQHRISYGVSLDGVATMHDTTRKFRSGSGSFGIVDHNLRRLIDAGVAVSVNTVVSNFNLAGLPDLTRYLIDLNIPFRYSVVRGEAIDAELLEKYLSMSHEIMAQAIEQGWAFSKKYQFCDLKPSELGFQTCASGFSGGAIYTGGSFKYCHVHFGKDDGHAQTIFDESIDLVEMIDRSGHHEDNKSEDCKKCRYRSVCTSGCPVYRKDGKDPQCSLYHKFIPMYYQLQAKERLKLLRKPAMVP